LDISHPERRVRPSACQASIPNHHRRASKRVGLSDRRNCSFSLRFLTSLKFTGLLWGPLCAALERLTVVIARKRDSRTPIKAPRGSIPPLPGPWPSFRGS
jgi:hypothetical protein